MGNSGALALTVLLLKFGSVHADVQNHFCSDRHLIDRQTYKTRRSATLAEWRNVMT